MPIIFLYLILALLFAQDAHIHHNPFEAVCALALLLITLGAGRHDIRKWLRG
jgi:hypothetical protein